MFTTVKKCSLTIFTGTQLMIYGSKVSVVNSHFSFSIPKLLTPDYLTLIMETLKEGFKIGKATLLWEKKLQFENTTEA